MEKIRMVSFKSYYAVQSHELFFCDGAYKNYWVNLICDTSKENVEKFFKEYCSDINQAKEQLKFLEMNDDLNTISTIPKVFKEFIY